ncbi:hypothetical protein JKG47_08345 [Acidithiobacillus sp. MC6.1]|nr:hypothetical protein [Acidithiobacillus sp. MC6.1]
MKYEELQEGVPFSEKAETNIGPRAPEWLRRKIERRWEMFNLKDKENLVKASQDAKILVQDLRELARSSNPLLGEIAIEMLQQAVLLEQRLNRVGTACAAEDVEMKPPCKTGKFLRNISRRT